VAGKQPEVSRENQLVLQKSLSQIGEREPARALGGEGWPDGDFVPTALHQGDTREARYTLYQRTGGKIFAQLQNPPRFLRREEVGSLEKNGRRIGDAGQRLRDDYVFFLWSPNSVRRL